MSAIFHIIILIIFGISYYTDDEFRERYDQYRNQEKVIKKIRDAEKERALIEYSDSEIDEQVFYEFKNDLKVFENCLNHPYYCTKFPDLKNKLKVELNDKYLIINSLNLLKNENKKSRYGCYCREHIDLNIFSNCPIDKLDEFCKKYYTCIKDSFYDNNYNYSCDKVIYHKLSTFNLEKKYENISIQKGHIIKKSRIFIGRIYLRNALQELLADYY